MSLWYHKVDSLRWLDGSIRQDLDADERSVWADFLALAALTPEPRRGFIERSEGMPYPKNVLVTRLNITEELYDRTIKKCVAAKRLELLPDGTMLIINWQKYNDVTEFLEAKRQKSIANKKARKSRESNQLALTREINRLNKEFARVNKKLRFVSADGDKILDTSNGQLYTIEEANNVLQ